ncbi:hypothetical protein ACE103_30105 [Bradyrhizobium sp. ma5]|uniref:hypothetical protein n=1 Tax=Bradyrhizobium sp. ma5 TaxID=3344828 RepID=UPI0035D4BA7E
MALQEYRVYVIGADDRILNRIDIHCANDAAVSQRAKQLLDNETIELWRGDQLLHRFEPM